MLVEAAWTHREAGGDLSWTNPLFMYHSRKAGSERQRWTAGSKENDRLGKVLAVVTAYSLVEGIRLIREVLMGFIEGKWKQTRDKSKEAAEIRKLLNIVAGSGVLSVRVDGGFLLSMGGASEFVWRFFV
jgi:hypothetical protein